MILIESWDKFVYNSIFLLAKKDYFQCRFSCDQIKKVYLFT